MFDCWAFDQFSFSRQEAWYNELPGVSELGIMSIMRYNELPGVSESRVLVRPIGFPVWAIHQNIRRTDQNLRRTGKSRSMGDDKVQEHLSIPGFQPAHIKPECITVPIPKP